MSEAGGIDLFTGPQPQEQSEQAKEQFREEQRRNKRQAQQQKKDEGKARQQDNSLANIIIQFLHEPGNTDLFLLISRCVAQNIPSEFILAVISLVHQPASEEVEAYLKAPETPPADTKALAVKESADFQALPPEHKQAIQHWNQQIYAVASKKPQKTLESVVINFKASEYRDDLMREISPMLIQLSAFILRNYLQLHQVAFEFDHLHDFMQTVFVGIVANLEALVQNQKQLDGDRPSL